jgi:hypothetical protein
MGQSILATHKIPYLLFIKLGEITGPIVLITQAPQYDGGVVIMLLYHIGEHAFCLRPVNIATQTATAPGLFFPNQNSQAIA